MKRRLALLLLLGLMIAAALPPAAAQEEDDPLAQLLAFVPAASPARDWLSYGDFAAWHASWGIPRPDSVADVNALDAVTRARWMAIMPRQTTPPQVFGLNYLLTSDIRGFYGFDIFQIDRALEGGVPPNMLTVAEHHADPAAIGAALRAAGYGVRVLEGGWTLYSLGEDYAMLGFDYPDMPQIGMIGQLNRIAVNGSRLLIARGMPEITAALAAESGGPSLANDAAFAAVGRALQSAAREDAGALLGALFVPGDRFLLDPAQIVMGQEVSEEQIAALQEAMQDPANQLPTFLLAGFGTRHGPGATYLTAAVALLPGEDADAFAAKVGDRMARYVSLRTGQPLSERWGLKASGGLVVDGVPVAWITMRVDDPPPAPEGQPANTGVLAWVDLVMARDYGFLVSGWPIK